MMRRLRKDSAVYKGGDVEKTQGSPRDLLKLLSYTRPYRVRLAIAFTSLLIASSIGLAFPTMVQEAAKEYSPAVIANYTYDLAKTFNQFYDACDVLKEPDADLKLFRL